MAESLSHHHPVSSLGRKTEAARPSGGTRIGLDERADAGRHARLALAPALAAG